MRLASITPHAASGSERWGAADVLGADDGDRRRGIELRRDGAGHAGDPGLEQVLQAHVRESADLADSGRRHRRTGARWVTAAPAEYAGGPRGGVPGGAVG